MKKIIFPLLALLALATACSPEDNNDSNPSSASNALIDPATGWKKVGTIAYRASTTGFEGYDAMTPYDLTVVGNELALLYSEDFRFTGTIGNNLFKVKFAPGQQDISGGIALPNGGYGSYYCNRFIPSSFEPVFMDIRNANGMFVCFIYNAVPGLIAGNNLGYSFPPGPINWYEDGGLTLGYKDGGNISNALSYTYPDTGNFNVTLNQWSLDDTQWRQSSALRLAGGELNEFIISYKDNKVFFSIIKDAPSYVPTNGVQHDFFMMARQEIPGLEAGKDPSVIIASKVENNTYTVLVGETGGNPAENYVNTVYCYQWQKGSTQFTKLYGPIAIPKEVGYNLYHNTTIGTPPDPVGFTALGAPVKFTPDNTAYMLFQSPAYDASVNYRALATINASELKISVKYDAADYPQGHYTQIGIGVCQYYQGAFYAVVYQKNSYVYANTDPKFRMEIVKLEL